MPLTHPPRTLLLQHTGRLGPGSRTFLTSPLRQSRMGDQPERNQPDSVSRKARNGTPDTDAQSSASKEEGKKGDDHPAKQPDYQAKPTRHTGFGGKEEVKGGKEGLGERTGG